jgi:hypothetical protein
MEGDFHQWFYELTDKESMKLSATIVPWETVPSDSSVTHDTSSGLSRNTSLPSLCIELQSHDTLGPDSLFFKLHDGYLGLCLTKHSDESYFRTPCNNQMVMGSCFHDLTNRFQPVWPQRK